MKTVYTVKFIYLMAMLVTSVYAAEPKVNENKATNASKVNSGLGINITGNLEAPKVLYILPWKTVEEGAPDPYVSGIIEEVFSPVDPVEFERSVQWHALGQSTSNVSTSIK
jgi:hypothetical protein